MERETIFEILFTYGLVGIIFSLAGILMSQRPPKEINGLYGYRTPRSMKNKENWDFAQRYAGRLMTAAGFVILALGIPVYFFQLVYPWNMIIFLTAVVGSAVVIIVRTEKALKRQFPDAPNG